MLEGRIIKNISNAYTIISDDKKYVCTPRGKFRNQKITPLVGDICKFDAKNNYMLEILPIKNELERPSIANVDYALLVTSMKNPSFSALLLDKEISSVILAKIKPIILFTKIDLLENQEIIEYQNLKKYYESINIPCFENKEPEKLLSFLKGAFVVLTGQTGAGKSTFLNKINPELNLKTDEISFSLNRGKHTTRHTEMFEISNIFFSDTPGFSSLELTKYTKEEIESSFKEFINYPCQFKNCMHLKEEVCGVKKAVEEKEILKSRYESYQKMINSKSN